MKFWKKTYRCGIVLWCAMKHASVIILLFLLWMKANTAEFWKSKVWLVKTLWEIKEFVVLPVLKSFYVHRFIHTKD